MKSVLFDGALENAWDEMNAEVLIFDYRDRIVERQTETNCNGVMEDYGNV